VTQWHTTPPTPADADPFGMVRWNPRLPGMLIPWSEVRPGEQWAHSAAWRPALNLSNSPTSSP
jgi:hypothetical protein